MPRFRIAWLMVAIVFVALDLAAIRGLLGVRDTYANLVGLGVLPMANFLALGAILSAVRPKCPPFLVGFEVFGAVAMLACHMWAWVSPDSLTRCLLALIVPVADSLRETWGEPATYYAIHAIASVLLTVPQVIFALVGGSLASLVAALVARRRRKRLEAVPESPP